MNSNRKKGSVLILMLAVVALILVFVTSLVIVNTSTHKVQISTDTVNRVNYIAESGIEVAWANYFANYTNASNIDSYITNLNSKLKTITDNKSLKSQDGSIWVSTLYIDTSSYRIVSTATNGNITKTLYHIIQVNDLNSGSDSHNILSPLFSTKRKFMIFNVTTNSNSDNNLNFLVKPGNDKKTYDEKFLFLNIGQYQNNFNNTDYSFSKNNGGNSGIKAISNSFFVFPVSDCTLPGIKSSSNNDEWITYPNTNVQYYVSSTSVANSINNSNLTSPNNAFIQGLVTNKDKVRVIIINGDITLDNIDTIHANTYLNNLIVYCTGTINLNNCNIQSGSNGNNGQSDINICFIGNNLNVQGANTVSYVYGNNFNSNDDATIKKIIGENITADVTWR
ncbi:hypothetical protein [Clostridium pasteurianum]|uniref:Uncharacterized protein n=1 Tax=Clostridium pasteurianum BC1 TaxID=86416 RepID=R4K6M2_CLOPA|nr:hypothetical protein [Clostridium pasteurianum]AGK98203.1 hypothetical protein Clopa_3409 [Clostridium pasteurianum BC1]